ncbi:ATP-binding protein [Paracoccus sp. TK19116]|uniref:histidine kinase n=1 Tax=Paracoccus albicereus TaxID=2922394 RepID=A0ABT1MQB6_9RHOB|nr:ATP-binding protein [Paracoccus albicereus]MCQ0970505.1 ATP-binding protein [Paracoccus albicereus]
MSVIRLTQQKVLVFLVLSIAACAFVVWQISADARRQIEHLATANTDSTQWSLAQTEVELLALLVAISDASDTPSDPEALAEVRSRFDVFYSRLRTLTTGRVFESLRQNEAAGAALAQISAVLDDAIPAIDAADPELRQALPSLGARIAALRPAVRSASLDGVRLFSDDSDRQREQLSSTMRDLALLVGLMAVAITVVVTALVVMANRARRQAAHIATTHARLQTVIATCPDAIVVADPNGRIVDFNEAAERIYGYSAAEAVNADMLSLIVPEAARIETLEFLSDMPSVATAFGAATQASAMRKSGEIFPIEATVARAPSDTGPVMVAFVRDITRQVEEADELIRARDQALAGERSKDEMLTVMSHEMRTPLNGLLGTLDLLAMTPLGEEQRRYVDVMTRSGELLLAHVNSVLDIARADAGALRLEEVPFGPSKLVRDLLDSLRAKALRRGNELSVRTDGSDGMPVLGDPARLTQILINLVGNAIKFTQNGRIDVIIDRRTAGQVEFRVRDTGIGIAPEDQERVFEDFVTLDASFNRNVEGTGLGLGIVRRLTRLMKGNIRIESERGQGACFVLTLPFANQPEMSDLPHEATSISAAAQTDRKVLVIEDNEVNRMVVRGMLEARSCHVVEAVDGQEGVLLARDQRFDVIFMDISMPLLDGVAASRLIRSEGPNKDVPIVALTAHVREEDEARFHAAGMNAVLAKPLSFRALDLLLDSLADDPPSPVRQDEARRYLAANIGEAQADKVLPRIRQEFHESLQSLKDIAPEPQRRVEAARLAHKMAGAVALIGLAALRDELVRLEEELTGEGDIRTEIAARLDRIDNLAP